MSMPKHYISFTGPQYTFLQKSAGKLGISVAELVRRAVDEYRMKGLESPETMSLRDIETLIRDVAGVWKDKEDGISYENKMRAQWKARKAAGI